MGDESGDSTGPTRAEGPQHSPAARNIKRANTTRKRRGEVAEAAFLAKAASLGFGVAKPWGDSERYDFILDSGHNFWDSGHNFWRVQVKSTRTRVRTRYVLTVVGRSRAPYSGVEVDFLAAYVVPRDLWYIIPIDAAGSRTSLYLCAGEGGESKFEKYRDAWCLMACPRAKVEDDDSSNQIPISCRCPQIPVRCAVCPLRT